ncbi:MAG: hypothetical protein WAW96_08655, partial [Alphaproteobacteria bacterium]
LVMEDDQGRPWPDAETNLSVEYWNVQIAPHVSEVLDPDGAPIAEADPPPTDTSLAAAAGKEASARDDAAVLKQLADAGEDALGQEGQEDPPPAVKRGASGENVTVSKELYDDLDLAYKARQAAKAAHENAVEIAHNRKKDLEAAEEAASEAIAALLGEQTGQPRLPFPSPAGKKPPAAKPTAKSKAKGKGKPPKGRRLARRSLGEAGSKGRK